MFNLAECRTWLGDNTVALQGNAQCSSIAIDSRQVQHNQLFAAFVGKHVDANHYVPQALANGASGVITEASALHECPNLQVNNLLAAIQTIGSARRQQFSGTVIGITGSLGKTTTKDACAVMLKQPSVSILATEGNYNNQLGVPMTLSHLEKQTLAVIELGISRPNDMHVIAKLTQPTVSIITNVAKSHIAHFQSINQIAEEKGHIIDYTADDGWVILNADDPFYSYWQKRAGKRQVLTVGFHTSANIRIESSKKYQTEHQIVLCHNNKYQRLHTYLQGIGATYAIAFAYAAAVACEINTVIAATRASSIPSATGRMQLITTHNYCLINDCYNANPQSMQSAIDYARQCARDQQVPLVLLLGDMLELGQHSTALHIELGKWLSTQDMPHETLVWAVGQYAPYIATTCGLRYLLFANVKQLCQALEKRTAVVPKQALVLIKASNAVNLKQCVTYLQRDS